MRRQRTLRVLGIETSCDETAAAVVDVSRQPRCSGRGRPTAPMLGSGQADSRKPSFMFDVRSNVVASQVRIHARTGGIVPEVAAREHVTTIISVVERALRWVRREEINAVAVTTGPGLITSLSVGAETARSLAYAWRKPLIGVNHIEGHVYSALLPLNGKVTHKRNPRSQILNPKQIQNSNFQSPKLAFPALALIVSGGHTELLLIRGWGQYRCIGATRDDAAGEAFDKVARILGLSYPGGPAVAEAAETGDPEAFDFPRGMLHSGDFDFSFSGLKTAVRYLIEKQCRGGVYPLPRADIKSAPTTNQSARDVCASFQQAVMDVLVAKTIAAARQYDVRTVILGGGVAANLSLREQLTAAIHDRLPHAACLMPHASYAGDNAAMIAAAGGVRLLLGERTSWQRLDVDANWELGR